VNQQVGQGLPELPFAWDGTDATGFILDPNRTYVPFIVLKSSDVALKTVPGQAVRFIAFIRTDGNDAVVTFGERAYVRHQARFAPEAGLYLDDLARRLQRLPTSDDEKNPLWKVMIWEPEPSGYLAKERRELWKTELEKRLARKLPDERFELLPTDGQPLARVILRNTQAPSTDRVLVRQAKGSSTLMEAVPSVVAVKDTPEAIIVELRHDRLFRVGSAYLRDETLPRVVEAMGQVRALAQKDREKKASLTGKAREKFESKKIVLRSYTERARDDKKQEREEDPKLAAARSKVLFMLFAREALLPE
jgi:flagellar motor protein MotB